VINVDVLSDDGDYVFSEQRVASPETRVCDVTKVESRFDHVVNTILRHIYTQTL